MDGCGYRIRGEDGHPAFCQRDDNHERKHKTQSGQEFSTTESLAYEAELEYNDYIATLRGELKTALKNASDYLLGAQTVITRLKSRGVYDVEFAEGNSHIETAVREAGLFTAAAQAMTDVLLK
jgi:hypothetical protein